MKIDDKNTKNGSKLLEPTYDDNGNLIPLSQRFNSRNEDTRFSVINRNTSIAKLDSEYDSAYESGDTEEEMRIINEVAKRNGYAYRGYHHTETDGEPFTKFDLGKARKSMDVQGFYFYNDSHAGDEYGSQTYDVFLKMNNPFVVDSKEAHDKFKEYFKYGETNAGVEARNKLIADGYDGVIMTADYMGGEADEYCVFNPSQIKSAEPETYDDYGYVISPSQRFNDYDEDIRFSVNDNNVLKKAEGFIARSLNGEMRNKSFTLELPSTTINRIREKTGIVYDSHNIDANSFVHAKRNHGVNGEKLTQNSIPLRDEDFLLAPHIMYAPDDIMEGSVDSLGRRSIRFISKLSNGVVVVVEKEQKNSPHDMDTITMWADMSGRVSHGQKDPESTIARSVISTIDAAKIRKKSESAIENDKKMKIL